MAPKIAASLIIVVIASFILSPPTLQARAVAGHQRLNNYGYFSSKRSAPAATPLKPVAIERIPKHVTIDAGHGGEDYGAISLGGLLEKDLTLEVARLISENLRQEGYETRMTRPADEFVSLKERSELSNAWKSDFFISVHGNSSTTPSLQGFEIYHLGQTLLDVPRVDAAANDAWVGGEAAKPETVGQLSSMDADADAVKNRPTSIRAAEILMDAVANDVEISAQRIRPARFRVLKWTQCPSILIELGYLSNPEDEARLGDHGYQKAIAKSIVRGFLKYSKEFEQQTD